MDNEQLVYCPELNSNSEFFSLNILYGIFAEEILALQQTKANEKNLNPKRSSIFFPFIH